ncbi:MAG: AsmA family protein [Deltaproteobacteria bacterium]|nr:AsmA family protein [Deltaproteobacteria bacterium]
MRVSKPLRWVLYVVGGLIAGLLLIIILLATIRIPIDLSSYKGVVESAASLAMGRTVKVDDRIVITTSLQPIFSLEGLRISNPKGFEKGDFLKMKTAEIQVRVLPLLLGKIQIAKFSVKGLAVMLVENKQGAVNWSSQTPDESKPEPPPQPKPPAEERQLELTSDSLVLAKLVLEDIAVDYRRPGLAEPLQFKIEECTGTMLPGKPFVLSMKGKLLKEPYLITVEVGSLQELVEESRSRMEIKTEIAKTHFDFAGSLDLARVSKTLQLKASVRGDHLDSLNGLLDLDLPPLKSYRAGAQLTLQKNRAELSDFVIQVGKSKLVGKMTVNKSGVRSEAVIDLSAPLIQLNDFDVGDWSPQKSDSEKPAPEKDPKKEKVTKAAQDRKSSADEGVDELLSPEVLARFNVRMNVKAEKVMSGTDELGSGVLTATLKDGRFSLDPVKLNIPGGSFSLAASLRPDKKAPQASIRVVMKKFDFGVLVRRANPKADMGGTINLDVDLKSSADSFDKLMVNGNGYFDFSGRLENLKAGIIDLWAVNLIAAVVSQKDEDASKINCVVGRWTLKDGLLKPDVFLIDTTKIRICAKGQVDFKKEYIDLKMAPTPKKAEYFSLATPVEVKGNFSDFGVGIQSGGLIGTAVRFIASPVTTTLQRLVGKELPADGADVCGMVIGPQDRSAKAPAGCK